MEKQDVPEKRKFPRINVASLVVIRCDVLATIRNKDRYEFHTHTENISEGGINVILDEELHNPDVVALKLYLTGKVAPIECKGEVIWSKVISPEAVKPSLFSTGIKFIGLSYDANEAIRNVITCFSEQK